MSKHPIIHRTNDRALGRTAEELAGGLEAVHSLNRRRFLSRAARAVGGAALGLASAARADKAITTES